MEVLLSQSGDHLSLVARAPDPRSAAVYAATLVRELGGTATTVNGVEPQLELEPAAPPAEREELVDVQLSGTAYRVLQRKAREVIEALPTPQRQRRQGGGQSMHYRLTQDQAVSLWEALNDPGIKQGSTPSEYDALRKMRLRLTAVLDEVMGVGR